MSKKNAAPNQDPKGLRERAEEELAKMPSAQDRPEGDAQRTLQELRVHQIELQMQNEALITLQGETQQALDEVRYLKEHLEETVAARTDQLIIAREEALAANRAKSTFLSTMSHELYTPMNGVLGLVELARRRASEPEVRDLLTRALAAARPLVGLIKDVLDISSMEASGIVLAKRKFTLGEVLAELEQAVAPSAREKGLRLRVEAKPDVAMLPLFGDCLRLGQVLFNLTNNAIKFTPAGAVTVRVSTSDETADDVELRLEVEDTGIGISAEDSARIFAPFEQADGSATRRFGGAGLGLALSQRIASRLGGSIELKSKPGAGSLFWLTARVQKAAGLAGAADGGVSPDELVRAQHPGERVLLAQDEAVAREIFRGLTEDLGLVVDVAEDGAAAVELARVHTYRLIILDMEMIKIGIVAATHLIRSLPGYKDVPILALSTNASEEDRQRVLGAGVNEYLVKPIEPADFDRALLRSLEWKPGHALPSLEEEPR